MTIVITNECPSVLCASKMVHFDLSEIAFGAMANPGHKNQLCNVGVLQLQYKKVIVERGIKNHIF